MKITLTGAAGRLGSHVCRALAEAGHSLCAVDQVVRTDLPVPIEVFNLLNREDCYPLVDGADTIIHLANHASDFGIDKQRILTENVTMNTHVFQAARELGVKNVIFASSIQAIGAGQPEGDTHVSTLAYLPIDGDLPALPENIYGLSKQLSEEMLRYYCREAGFNAVALRFPHLTNGVPGLHRTHRHVYLDRLNEGWAYLSFADATALVLAILNASLTGFRIYSPAARSNSLFQPAAPLIAKYFSDVPLKKPLEEFDSFYDNSQITRDTGWEPRDEWTPGMTPPTS